MSRLTLIVKAGAKINKITAKSDGTLEIQVKEPAKEGKANAAVIKLLGKHLGCSQSSLRIVSGHTGKRKVIEIS